jgi:hypothetical protein
MPLDFFWGGKLDPRIYSRCRGVSHEGGQSCGQYQRTHPRPKTGLGWGTDPLPIDPFFSQSAYAARAERNVISISSCTVLFTCEALIQKGVLVSISRT